MTTQSLISMIKRGAPDWGRTEILDLINDVNTEMMSHELNINRVIDPSTGKDPILVTTAGIFSYEIVTTQDDIPENGLIVTAVYSGQATEGDFNRPPVSSSLVKTHFVRGSGEDNAKVIFHDDPQGKEFYIRYYKKPTEILTESTALDVPSQWYMKGIRTGVIALIQDMEHGRTDAWDKWSTEILPSFWADVNKDTSQYGYSQESRGY